MIKNSLIKVALLGLALASLAGCLAKSAPKVAYYELNYDPSGVSGICDRRMDTLVNLLPISAASAYQSRNIIKKDGLKAEPLANAKFAAYPKDMLQKAISLYFNANCHVKEVAGSKLNLSVHLMEMSLANGSAFVQIKANLADKDRIYMDKVISINEPLGGDAIKALNSAMIRAIAELHESVREH